MQHFNHRINQKSRVNKKGSIRHGFSGKPVASSRMSLILLVGSPDCFSPLRPRMNLSLRQVTDHSDFHLLFSLLSHNNERVNPGPHLRPTVWPTFRAVLLCARWTPIILFWPTLMIHHLSLPPIPNSAAWIAQSYALYVKNNSQVQSV